MRQIWRERLKAPIAIEHRICNHAAKNGDKEKRISRHLTAVDNPVPEWHHGFMERVIGESRKRITARVSENMRATLEEAAELLGATVNQFVVQAAYQEAQRILERESVIRLSQTDARKVLSLLDSPPEPSKALKEAVKAFKRSVRA